MSSERSGLDMSEELQQETADIESPQAEAVTETDASAISENTSAEVETKPVAAAADAGEDEAPAAVSETLESAAPEETSAAAQEAVGDAPVAAKADVIASGAEDAAEGAEAAAADATAAGESEAPAAEAEAVDQVVDVSATDETTADEPTTDEATADEPTTMEQALETTPEVARLKRGTVLEGTVTETSPTAVLVDVGGKVEGIIPGRELERMNRQTLEMLQPGNQIPVFVVNPNDHQGQVVLSVNRALEELDWQEAEAYRENRRVYESQIAGYNRGGLIVRFGRVRGFVPQSQLSDTRLRLMSGSTPEERWGEMVNDAISVKVIEVDRSRNRLILSERAATRETRDRRKESLINELTVGEVRSGRVVSLEDFGAFVDIGGAEGLVHLTELSWKHLTHPREILSVGQAVNVEVISVDRKRKRIGLSVKSQEPDPWDEVAINYADGQLVQGVVTKLARFGAFARPLDAPDIEGLIHISELSEQRVNHPRDVVDVGDRLTMRVIKVDVVNRRLGLSLKRVNSAEYLDMDWDLAAAEPADSAPTAAAPEAAADEAAAEAAEAPGDAAANPEEE